MYAEQFRAIKPYVNRLWNTPEGQPLDPEAKSKVDSLNEKLRVINLKHGFPSDWIMKYPTQEILAQVWAKNRTDEEARKKAEEEAEAARKRAEEEAKAAKNKAANGYPWKTLDTTDGRRIIAGRQHTRRGESQDKSTLIVASDLSDDPIYETTTSSNVGALEVEEFFKLDGIKLLAEKDEMGRDVQTWTWRDEDDFEEFLWCTRGTIDTHMFGKGSRAPATYCGVRFKKRGMNILTKTNLENVVKKKKAKSLIEEYCKRKGIPPPWEVEAENEKVPKDKKILAAQTWLAEQGLGNFAAPPAAKTMSAAASATGNSALKSLEDRLAAMEKKIPGLQSPNIGSLDSILNKLEERLASMETKMTSMDTKMASMETKITEVDRIAASSAKLGQVVDLLVAKIGGLDQLPR
jgi:hypothetical protein